MGWASYDTPLGPAGYAHEDVCHLDGCNERIDRGLAYLCGDQPGRASEGGCGRWFCGKHLFMGFTEMPRGIGGGYCQSCLDQWETDHPGAIEREELEIQRRIEAYRAEDIDMRSTEEADRA